MGFLIAGLSLLVTANGFSMWHYTTTDAKATVDSDGYFTGDALNMLKVGDIVWVFDSDAQTMQIMGVLTNDGTTVDLSDGTTIDLNTDADYLIGEGLFPSPLIEGGPHGL